MIFYHDHRQQSSRKTIRSTAGQNTILILNTETVFQ